MNKTLYQIIKSDLFRITGHWSIFNYYKYYFKEPGFRFIVSLRKIKYYQKKNKLLFYVHLIKYELMRRKYGFQIPFNAEIGEGFYIGHYGRIIINPDVKIGRNVNISTGITIGQENRGVRKGSPEIGDNVWIGTNAVIVGKIKIGNNVLIAPNSYINFNVPDNSIIIGNPAKIIPNDKATEEYICNCV